ncbi:MAG: GntR family transcriptional regulator, partial [Verrucomicrobiota bacterium]
IAAVYLDPTTNRIVASTRLSRHLSRDTPTYVEGQAVNLLITSQSPLGYNAIVENAHRGLLYRDNLSSPLEIGQKVKGFVRVIRANGKIDLRLDASGYKRVLPLQVQIVQAMERNGGQLNFDDASSPEEIRKTFGASKGAFKQALGALYKNRRIRFQNPGIELLDNTSWTPGK